MNYNIKTILALCLCLISSCIAAMERQHCQSLKIDTATTLSDQILLDDFLDKYHYYVIRFGCHPFFKLLFTASPTDGQDLIDLKKHWEDLKKVTASWADPQTTLTAALTCCHGDFGAQFACHLIQYYKKIRTDVCLGDDFGSTSGVLQIMADPTMSAWSDDRFTRFLKLYCKKGLPLDRSNEWGQLPVHVIAKYRTLEDVKLACANKSWALKRDEKELTPFNYAHFNPHYNTWDNPMMHYLYKKSKE